LKIEEAFEVIVIGAGAAGLAAATELGNSGVSVLILEARERIGGRILTLRDPVGVPVEMGAEFIHGRPPEVLALLTESKTQISEVTGNPWCSNGQLSPCNFTDDVHRILSLMNDKDLDQSFSAFLEQHCPDQGDARQQEAKRHALNYVTGFNAADPDSVGTHWLVKGMREEERIEGDRAFRCANGYEDVMQILRSRLEAHRVSLRTEAEVVGVTWSPGSAEVSLQNHEGVSIYKARQVVVSVPLSILKIRAGDKGAIEFTPPLPHEKLAALNKLEMGKVLRLVLRFRDRFWNSITPQGAHGKSLSDMGFLFSNDEWFPTWWTTMPLKEPLITGWAPFQCAERLSGKDHHFVVNRGLTTLSRLLAVSLPSLEECLEGAYFHDWQCDPFSRGAYTYGKVGADGAQEALAKPLADTVFFAGEATASPGSNGTVHGAMASGYRAAREMLSARC
jgi:monoamine oxidase